MPPTANDIDYRLAFDLAPIGMVLSRNRTMVDCNQRVCEMFGVSREQLIGQTFQLLYPSVDEYERTGQRIAPLLNTNGVYADDRVMKRVDGRLKGETFWCHVTGRALGISHRTVEIYRVKLMRKYQASGAADLIQKLVRG